MSSEPLIKSDILCYHCGDLCRDKSIFIDDKYFCCAGCKTVYEILNKGELCNYYSFKENPGISPKNFESKKFEYLDDSSTIDKLLDFKDNAISKVTFFIPQMQLQHIDLQFSLFSQSNHPKIPHAKFDPIYYVKPTYY